MSCREFKPLGPQPWRRGPARTRSETVALALETAMPRGDCLLATFWTPMVKGYVRATRVDERGPQMIHRFVVEEAIGRRLESGETVDHVCHNNSGCVGGNTCAHRRCVNIQHLEVVGAIENWGRGQRGAPAMWSARTHCPSGHPYEPENLAKQTYGRKCKACARAHGAGRDKRAEPTYLT